MIKDDHDGKTGSCLDSYLIGMRVGWFDLFMSNGMNDCSLSCPSPLWQFMLPVFVNIVVVIVIIVFVVVRECL